MIRLHTRRATMATLAALACHSGEGVNTQRRYRTANVWMKRQGRWQVVAAHTAMVLDARQVASLQPLFRLINIRN